MKAKLLASVMCLIAVSANANIVIKSPNPIDIKIHKGKIVHGTMTSGGGAAVRLIGSNGITVDNEAEKLVSDVGRGLWASGYGNISIMNNGLVIGRGPICPQSHNLAIVRANRGQGGRSGIRIQVKGIGTASLVNYNTIRATSAAANFLTDKSEIYFINNGNIRAPEFGWEAFSNHGIISIVNNGNVFTKGSDLAQTTRAPIMIENFGDIVLDGVPVTRRNVLKNPFGLGAISIGDTRSQMTILNNGNISSVHPRDAAIVAFGKYSTFNLVNNGVINGKILIVGRDMTGQIVNNGVINGKIVVRGYDSNVSLINPKPVLSSVNGSSVISYTKRQMSVGVDLPLTWHVSDTFDINFYLLRGQNYTTGTIGITKKF